MIINSLIGQVEYRGEANLEEESGRVSWRRPLVVTRIELDIWRCIVGSWTVLTLLYFTLSNTGSTHPLTIRTSLGCSRPGSR